MPNLKNHSDLMNKVFNMGNPGKTPTTTTHEQLQRLMDSLPAPPAMSVNPSGILFSKPEYGPGGAELLSYLEEKREIGIIEGTSVSLPPEVKINVITSVGAYLGVLEPWLHRYVRDCGVVCDVDARYIGGARLTRRELRSLAVHFKISVQMEVTPCFKGDGVFQYNGPYYKLIVR